MVSLFVRHGWDCLELSECHAYDLLMQGDPEATGRTFHRFAADQGLTFLQGHLLVRWYSHASRHEGTET
jgi:hypothetical protein